MSESKKDLESQNSNEQVKSEKLNDEKIEETNTEKDKAKEKYKKEEIYLPKPTFSTFILSMGSSALVQLGEVPNPETGETEKNIKLAKHTIDMLTMLDEKIKGGLDEDETRLMEGLLYELRMKYVMKSE